MYLPKCIAFELHPWQASTSFSDTVPALCSSTPVFYFFTHTRAPSLPSGLYPGWPRPQMLLRQSLPERRDPISLCTPSLSCLYLQLPGRCHLLSEPSWIPHFVSWAKHLTEKIKFACWLPGLLMEFCGSMKCVNPKSAHSRCLINMCCRHEKYSFPLIPHSLIVYAWP